MEAVDPFMRRSNLELKRLAHWALLTLAVWTAVVGYSLFVTVQSQREGAMAMARNTARANFFKDQAFRLWASGKGGLYAVVSPQSQPIPYMAHVPDRDVETREGVRLTLMNPASMLRETMDQYADMYGIRGRIVGVVTLNPANRADAWEEKAIHAFERGEKEIFEVADMGGRPYLRLIRPMIMQPACMKCHGHLGFKVGDVRGAVGVSVPLNDYLEPVEALQRQAEFTHGAIWLFGLVGGGLFFRGQRQRILEREASLEDLALSARVFDDALHGIAITDPQGTVLRVNQAFTRITGYAREDVVDRSIALLQADKDGRGMEEIWRSVTQEGRWQGDLWMRRRDGTAFAAAAHDTALMDERGVTTHVICMVEDITQRRRAEESLRTFQAMAEASVDAIVMLDPDTTVLIYANRAAHEMFGCEHGHLEMVGMRDRDFWTEEDRGLMETAISQAMEAGWRGDVRRKRRDGGMIDTNITMFSMLDVDGRFATIVALIRDITESRRAEEILRLTQFAVESSSIAFQWISQEGRVVGCNRRAHESLGMTREEFVGMWLWDFYPNFRPEAMEAFWHDLKHAGQLTAESRHRRKDGSVFPVEVTSNYVEFDGQEYAFSYAMDITGRKAAETALRELNANLEARVRQEVANNREKDHLLIQQSRLAAMGEMMGNIAHQWRQPINALSLVLANIKDAFEFGQLDEDYLDGQMERGINLIHKMSTTIDDFRNFFRPDRTPQPFSLAKAARDATMIVELAYAHARIDLALQVEAEAICQGLPNEYAQVVLNLLSNAKDAIVERGVDNGRVDIRIGQDEGRGSLILTDNGGGIPEDVLPKVFDPYFTTREKGTGIGLYMSRMIIENMGGRIEVANVNGGVQVTLTTPLAMARPPIHGS